MNSDDVELLRELDARKTAQLFTAEATINAADALMDGLHRTRGICLPDLIQRYDDARAAHAHECNRHDPFATVAVGVESP